MAADSSCNCYRWAFSFHKALENDDVNFLKLKYLLFYNYFIIIYVQLEHYYRKAIQSVSEEDYEKVVAFRHKDDSLACLAGRLFLRQVVRRVSSIFFIKNSSYKYVILINYLYNFLIKFFIFLVDWR